MQEQFYTTEGNDLQRLLSMGFSTNEAERMIHMKNHVTDQVEYQEMMAESRRLDFVRWLIDNNRMSR
jgi:hypothetical protein